MRLSAPVDYQKVSQVLVKGACPFLRVPEEFQSKMLRDFLVS
jgi:hypothetical protein